MIVSNKLIFIFLNLLYLSKSQRITSTEIKESSYPQKTLYGLPPLPDDTDEYRETIVPQRTTTQKPFRFMLPQVNPIAPHGVLPHAGLFNLHGATKSELPVQHESKYKGHFDEDGMFVPEENKAKKNLQMNAAPTFIHSTENDEKEGEDLPEKSYDENISIDDQTFDEDVISLKEGTLNKVNLSTIYKHNIDNSNEHFVKDITETTLLTTAKELPSKVFLTTEVHTFYTTTEKPIPPQIDITQPSPIITQPRVVQPLITQRPIIPIQQTRHSHKSTEQLKIVNNFETNQNIRNNFESNQNSGNAFESNQRTHIESNQNNFFANVRNRFEDEQFGKINNFGTDKPAQQIRHINNFESVKEREKSRFEGKKHNRSGSSSESRKRGENFQTTQTKMALTGFEETVIQRTTTGPKITSGLFTNLRMPIPPVRGVKKERVLTTKKPIPQIQFDIAAGGNGFNANEKTLSKSNNQFVDFEIVPNQVFKNIPPSAKVDNIPRLPLPTHVPKPFKNVFKNHVNPPHKVVHPPNKQPPPFITTTPFPKRQIIIDETPTKNVHFIDNNRAPQQPRLNQNFIIPQKQAFLKPTNHIPTNSHHPNKNVVNHNNFATPKVFNKNIPNKAIIRKVFNPVGSPSPRLPLIKSRKPPLPPPMVHRPVQKPVIHQKPSGPEAEVIFPRIPIDVINPSDNMFTDDVEQVDWHSYHHAIRSGAQQVTPPRSNMPNNIPPVQINNQPRNFQGTHIVPNQRGAFGNPLSQLFWPLFGGGARARGDTTAVLSDSAPNSALPTTYRNDQWYKNPPQLNLNLPGMENQQPLQSVPGTPAQTAVPVSRSNGESNQGETLVPFHNEDTGRVEPYKLTTIQPPYNYEERERRLYTASGNNGQTNNNYFNNNNMNNNNGYNNLFNNNPFQGLFNIFNNQRPFGFMGAQTFVPSQ
uniref:Uncharacterized protein n=1 Tax=Rhabditophanes sp. KR3021 TaxID=114890 RepID=A0AC35TL24_9BILA